MHMGRTEPIGGGSGPEPLGRTHDGRPRVTIIVPVFNAEDTIGRCLESIAAQTFQDYEVLLVDDGSSDGSPALCENYADSDQRIRVLHQSNNGPSSARNRGLNHARGQYVYFADSDDVLNPKLLETMLRCLESTHTQLAFLRYRLIDENSGNEIPDTRGYNYPAGRSLSSRETISLLLPDRFPSFVWSFMAERTLFDTSPIIRFPENILREDQAILYKLVDRTEPIGFAHEQLYDYHVRERSLLGSKSGSALMITSVLELAKDRQTYLDAHRPELHIETCNANIDLLSFILKTTKPDERTRYLSTSLPSGLGS